MPSNRCCPMTHESRTVVTETFEHQNNQNWLFILSLHREVDLFELVLSANLSF